MARAVIYFLFIYGLSSIKRSRLLDIESKFDIPFVYGSSLSLSTLRERIDCCPRSGVRLDCLTPLAVAIGVAKSTSLSMKSPVKARAAFLRGLANEVGDGIFNCLRS